MSRALPFGRFVVRSVGSMRYPLAFCQHVSYIGTMNPAILTTSFQIRTSAEWLSRVDEWRRGQPDIPTRAEAVRRLVEAALDAADKPAPARKKGR